MSHAQGVPPGAPRTAGQGVCTGAPSTYIQPDPVARPPPLKHQSSLFPASTAQESLSLHQSWAQILSLPRLFPSPPLEFIPLGSGSHRAVGLRQRGGGDLCVRNTEPWTGPGGSFCNRLGEGVSGREGKWWLEPRATPCPPLQSSLEGRGTPSLSDRPQPPGTTPPAQPPRRSAQWVNGVKELQRRGWGKDACPPTPIRGPCGGQSQLPRGCWGATRPPTPSRPAPGVWGGQQQGLKPGQLPGPG